MKGCNLFIAGCAAAILVIPRDALLADVRPAIELQSAPLNASVNEVGIRSFVANQIAPSFPDESLRLGHQGVAVAGIHFSPSGVIERVEILESPDSWIASSMKEALSKWTLEFERPNPPRMASKATYYFIIAGGRGRVFAPDNAPRAREWSPRTTILDRQRMAKGAGK